MLTAERIDARTALDWGLINRVVPLADLTQEANDLAERIAGFSGPALEVAKRMLWTVPSETPEWERRHRSWRRHHGDDPLAQRQPGCGDATLPPRPAKRWARARPGPTEMELVLTKHFAIDLAVEFMGSPQRPRRSRVPAFRAFRAGALARKSAAATAAAVSRARDLTRIVGDRHRIRARARGPPQ